ncbi:hypothetical protein RRG08_066275 [Elysia crispata]|uniref:Uncharacterized protein n=1 Tax=Elysia crispata TaxID=231223 RepID=A0AAE1E3R5_9GAST|nr:hypothetical protein RRG08_066275 [Elysia crispata]
MVAPEEKRPGWAYHPRDQNPKGFDFPPTAASNGCPRMRRNVPPTAKADGCPSEGRISPGFWGEAPFE